MTPQTLLITRLLSCDPNVNEVLALIDDLQLDLQAITKVPALSPDSGTVIPSIP